MRRESISRPTASVPKGKLQSPPSSQAGGRRKYSRYCSIGGWGAIRSAESATRTMATTVTRPTTAPVFSLK